DPLELEQRDVAGDRRAAEAQDLEDGAGLVHSRPGSDGSIGRSVSVRSGSRVLGGAGRGATGAGGGVAAAAASRRSTAATRRRRSRPRTSTVTEMLAAARAVASAISATPPS